MQMSIDEQRAFLDRMCDAYEPRLKQIEAKRVAERKIKTHKRWPRKMVK